MGRSTATHAGQAQKETFVNSAHALVDALLHPAIEGETASPPVEAVDGDCWPVADGASGEFAGQSGMIAARQAGVWLFAEVRDGMRVFDRSSGQHILFASGWLREPAPVLSSGGDTVDTQARAAIESVIIALQKTGIFPME